MFSAFVFQPSSSVVSSAKRKSVDSNKGDGIQKGEKRVAHVALQVSFYCVSTVLVCIIYNFRKDLKL